MNSKRKNKAINRDKVVYFNLFDNKVSTQKKNNDITWLSGILL